MGTPNILYFNDIGQEVGGAEKSFRFLIERIDKNRFNAIFVCLSEGSLVDNLRKAGIEVNIIRANKKVISITRSQLLYNPISLLIFIIFCLPVIKNLIGLINDKNINIVHTNSLKAHVLGGIAAKLAKKHLIWHIRELLLNRFSLKLLILLSRTLPDRIIVICSKHRELFVNYIRKDKIVTIHNGIDVDSINENVDKQKIRQEFSLNQDAPLIGLVSRLIYAKGHVYFLKAAKQVKRFYPGVKFLIVGDVQGNKRYKQKLLKLVNNLGLSNDVIFTGWREDIQNVMVSLDILAVPSLDVGLEGESRVILEAMAAAKPVVTTKVGGNPELIQEGQTGILIPPCDIGSLAFAICTLLKNPVKLKKMGIEGQKRIRQYFSLQANVKATQEVYLEIV